jgi:phosphohistidine phosphatase
VSTLRFYLVRHAPAAPKEGGGDAARRLTAEGRAAFLAHARALAPRLALSRIAASPYLRARETAALLAGETGAAAADEDALASGASSGAELLALGVRLGQGAALVGHNPEIGEAVALAAGLALEVRAGAVAAIDADADTFRLAWLEAPAP